MKWLLVAFSVIVGGCAKHHAPNWSVERTSIGHLVKPRYGASAVTVDGKIYIFGGKHGASTNSSVESYDPKTNSSEIKSDKLLPRAYGGAAAVDGQIYILTGIGSDGLLTTIETYNPATNVVSTYGEVRTPRMHAGVVAIGYKIYVIGGTYFNGSKSFQTAQVECYDVTTKRWSSLTPLKRARECSAVVAGNRIIVSGGYVGRPGASRSVESYDPDTGDWSELSNMGVALSAHCSAVIDGVILMFGDYQMPLSAYGYDLRTEETSPIICVHAGSRHSVAAVCGGKLYVIGGTNSTDGLARDDIESFSLHAITRP